MAKNKNFDELDIFSTSVDDIELFKTQKQTVFYSPKAKDGPDGTYKALIRFMPNIKNPKLPIIRKFTYWLESPDGKGQNFDSPSTIGEKCPIQQVYYKLNKSDSAQDRKIAEKLKRRETFYSLIKVIKDPQKPENDGRYFILKYGIKLKQKIDDEMSPSFDEPTQVFNPITGKNFELIVTKQGEYNNYDTSKFQSKKTPVLINGSPIDTSEASKEAIREELKNAPDLSLFEYKSWDDEERAQVEKFLSYYTSRATNIEKIVNPKPKPTPTAFEKSKDDFEEEHVSSSQKESKSDSGDLDEFLGTLGI
jgi:hypothetical protein